MPKDLHKKAVYPCEEFFNFCNIVQFVIGQMQYIIFMSVHNQGQVN